MRTSAASRSALSPSRSLALAFLAAIAVGTGLLMLPACSAPGKTTSLVDALFTATSATCVTGLSSVDTQTHFTWTGQFVILALIQWGGLGNVLFSSAALLMFSQRIGLRERLSLQENLPGFSLAASGRLSRLVLGFFLGCEAVGALLLWLVWGRHLGGLEGVWASVFHSVSAFCNAGFSTFSANLADYATHLGLNLVIMALIVLGGLGYLVCGELYLRVLNRSLRRQLSLHTRIVLAVTAVLIPLGALGILFFEGGNPGTLGTMGLGHGVLASFFQSVSCRTAGFNTIAMGELREETLQWMMLLMFIGGAPGSAAGGIKVSTFGILMLASVAQLRGRREVEAWGRRIPWARVLQALSLTIVAVLTVMGVTIVLNYLEELPYNEILFETVSALATAGLSTGVTPQLQPGSKVLLCLAMFAGRVGPLTLAASLIARRIDTPTRYPEGEVVIG